MNDSPLSDLEQVRSELAAWRAAKKGHPPIPEQLWSTILALLDRYPLDLVCRQLALRPTHVRKRLARRGASDPSSPAFLDLTSALLDHPPRSALGAEPTPLSRLQIERADGARLSLSLPADAAARLEQFLLAFARG